MGLFSGWKPFKSIGSAVGGFLTGGWGGAAAGFFGDMLGQSNQRKAMSAQQQAEAKAAEATLPYRQAGKTVMPKLTELFQRSYARAGTVDPSLKMAHSLNLSDIKTSGAKAKRTVKANSRGLNATGDLLRLDRSVTDAKTRENARYAQDETASKRSTRQEAASLGGQLGSLSTAGVGQYAGAAQNTASLAAAQANERSSDWGSLLASVIDKQTTDSYLDQLEKLGGGGSSGGSGVASDIEPGESMQDYWARLLDARKMSGNTSGSLALKPKSSFGSYSIG